MKKSILSFALAALALGSVNTAKADSLLIKIAIPSSLENTMKLLNQYGLNTSVVTDSWIEINSQYKISQLKPLLERLGAVHVQKNHKIKILENPAYANLKNNPAALKYIAQLAAKNQTADPADNPAIPTAPTMTPGADPLFQSQWGMSDIGVKNAWMISPNSNKIIVAVIDTGVDYTHEDLVNNMWRNPKEIPNNGIDDDNNGYIDDIVGWDFLGNDNKPYDLASTNPLDLLFKGANPGHGTHCAGNVAAVGNNSKGISGVAPQAEIMALRFIGSEGGTTAAAIKSIHYAVDNGAKVLSNSWGSEGEDPKDPENQALRDAVKYAMDHDVLFIAAAGNGHQGIGYDNDTDAKPGYPASYDTENIISVAAIGSDDKLGSFSNWGKKTVDIAAPGVKVFSTTVNSTYSDTVIGIPGVFVLATWDGTSMATPHVAGAAALYWAAHPEKKWNEVKEALMTSAKPVAEYANKLVTGGKLNVEALMKK